MKKIFSIFIVILFAASALSFAEEQKTASGTETANAANIQAPSGKSEGTSVKHKGKKIRAKNVKKNEKKVKN